MKGTAMVVVGGAVTAASAACKFQVPFKFVQRGNFKQSFSCDLSESCCHGVRLAEWDAFTADGIEEARVLVDLSGTCSRADQVDLYQCAVDTMPKLVEHRKEEKMRAMIHSKGCPNVAANLAQSHEVNQCSVNVGKGKGFKIGALSDSCCGALNNVMHAKGAGKHAAGCGLIGVCGEKDQMTLLKLAFGKGLCSGQGPWCKQSELELLETFNMTNAGAPQMMATFMTSMTSEAEDDVIEDDDNEDDVTEDGSPIGTGILGFVAGAAVTGLGVAALRRRTPSSQNEYNEIVA